MPARMAKWKSWNGNPGYNRSPKIPKWKFCIMVLPAVFRGSKNLLAYFNDATSAANANTPSASVDAGSGFLMQQGYALAWVAWSAGVASGGGRMTAQLPIATQNGQPLTGMVRTVLWDAEFGGTTPYTLPLSGYSLFNSIPTISTDQNVAQAVLKVRSSDSIRPSGPVIPEGTVVPTSQWS